MSEKIFTLHEKWVDEDGCQRTYAVLEDGVLWNSFITQYDADKTCKKLNELSEEIKYLKPLANENSSYIDDMEDDIISFRQEIEKLKTENKELKYQINEQSNEKMGLEEDIERLLKEINELKLLENEKLVENMDEKLSDKEKALLIMEKSKESFRDCEKKINNLNIEFINLKETFEYAQSLLKKVLNEEENNGNIHKDCEWYDEESDSCSNYMMGKYTGLAFEVSRHKICIKDMVMKDD